MDLDLGNGVKMYGLSDKDARFLLARKAFNEKYCKEKGWPEPDKLTFEQILEIRKQEGWKNPLGEKA